MARDERGARILAVGSGKWDDRPVPGVVFTTTVTFHGQDVHTHLWSESERLMDWPERRRACSRGHSSPPSPLS
jgi:hypothetical protein